MDSIWDKISSNPFDKLDHNKVNLKYKKPTGKAAPKVDFPPVGPPVSLPVAFRPPKLLDLTPWECLPAVRDFDKKEGKILWGGLPKPPPSISACYEHMRTLGPEYGNWLESRLQHWETRGKQLESEHPNWREDLKDPTVAQVLPPTCNPYLHRELLQAAGADASIVDEILDGIRMADPDSIRQPSSWNACECMVSKPYYCAPTDVG